MNMLMEMLKRAGAVKFGDFTLSSGKKSNIYIDIKIACTHPEVLWEINRVKKLSLWRTRKELIEEM